MATEHNSLSVEWLDLMAVLTLNQYRNDKITLWKMVQLYIKSHHDLNIQLSFLCTVPYIEFLSPPFPEFSYPFLKVKKFNRKALRQVLSNSCQNVGKPSFKFKRLCLKQNVKEREFLTREIVVKACPKHLNLFSKTTVLNTCRDTYLHLLILTHYEIQICLLSQDHYPKMGYERKFLQ